MEISDVYPALLSDAKRLRIDITRMDKAHPDCSGSELLDLFDVEIRAYFNELVRSICHGLKFDVLSKSQASEIMSAFRTLNIKRLQGNSATSRIDVFTAFPIFYADELFELFSVDDCLAIADQAGQRFKVGSISVSPESMGEMVQRGDDDFVKQFKGASITQMFRLPRSPG